MYEAVIFDLDDTLLRTHPIKKEHHRWVAKNHFDFDVTDEIFYAHYGKPFDIMLEGFYEGSGATIEDLIPLYRASEHLFHKQVFADTVDVLSKLTDANITMGIVTATMSAWAIDDLTLNNVDVSLFSFIQGAADSEFHKPDPRVFDGVFVKLEAEGISRDRMVYVGDGLVDHGAASSAGLDFIAVTTGLFSRDRFDELGVTHVVDSLVELLPLLTPN